MRYLIDGYNLLYALGLAQKKGGRAAWDRARGLLLDWIADQHRAAPRNVVVALDAQYAKGKERIEESHRGICIVRHQGQSADEVIEELVASEQEPEGLTVVSNDARVRGAAKAHRCLFQSCEEYVDAILNPQNPPATAALAGEEKEIQLSRDEQAELLKAFGG
jgi:predicted RNA-binding protein with PIN domain